ncbi:MAG TPA: winged helix DNA-binding domain-containing protein [Pyrinomonadaceae bacterium]|jgi:hypothetical protein|nr:winged helix DNA-binding domain-containing protein [Pyrinomonadaceae bacterium]
MPSLDIRKVRLQNQHLLQATITDPVDVLKALVAIQAQDYYGAKWALAQRTVNCTDATVEKAFTDGRILRLHVMRPTWHFVTPADIRWLVKLTAPRVNAVSSYYYRKAELDHHVFKRTNKALIKALQGGRQLTRDELRLAVKRTGIEPGDSMRFGYIMHRAELDGIVCSGGRRENQFTYALVDERVTHSRTLDADEALGELTERYFKSRAPATIHDYVWWSGLTASQAKRGIEIVGSALRSEILDGQKYWLSARTQRSIKDSPRRVHLLPAYDEYFIAYKDRSAAMHPSIDQKRIAPKLIFDTPLVIDGQACGGWKRVVQKDAVTVSVTPFKPLNRTDRGAVNSACADYALFIGKEAQVEYL